MCYLCAANQTASANDNQRRDWCRSQFGYSCVGGVLHTEMYNKDCQEHLKCEVPWEMPAGCHDGPNTTTTAPNELMLKAESFEVEDSKAKYCWFMQCRPESNSYCYYHDNFYCLSNGMVHQGKSSGPCFDNCKCVKAKCGSDESASTKRYAAIAIEEPVHSRGSISSAPRDARGLGFVNEERGITQYHTVCDPSLTGSGKCASGITVTSKLCRQKCRCTMSNGITCEMKDCRNDELTRLCTQEIFDGNRKSLCAPRCSHCDLKQKGECNKAWGNLPPTLQRRTERVSSLSLRSDADSANRQYWLQCDALGHTAGTCSTRVASLDGGKCQELCRIVNGDTLVCSEDDDCPSVAIMALCTHTAGLNMQHPVCAIAMCNDNDLDCDPPVNYSPSSKPRAMVKAREKAQHQAADLQGLQYPIFQCDPKTNDMRCSHSTMLNAHKCYELCYEGLDNKIECRATWDCAAEYVYDYCFRAHDEPLNHAMCALYMCDARTLDCGNPTNWPTRTKRAAEPQATRSDGLPDPNCEGECRRTPVPSPTWTETTLTTSYAGISKGAEDIEVDADFYILPTVTCIPPQLPVKCITINKKVRREDMPETTGMATATLRKTASHSKPPVASHRSRPLPYWSTRSHSWSKVPPAPTIAQI